MIKTLEDAGKWYKAVRKLAYVMRRLASKLDDPALERILIGNRNRDLDEVQLGEMAKTILDDLDDLAVLMLFSVFEATVRARAKADVDRETASIQHPAVLHAVKNLKDAIENGSFGKVTEAYKTMDVDLTEQINQVRKFRNWVAHGRRDVPENNVNPDDAIERLRRYLSRLTEIEEAGAVAHADQGVAPLS